MRLKTALFTAAVILFWSCLFGCANESCSDTPTNTEAQAYSVASTNLDGISVYSSINSVSYKATDEPQELEPNELLVFINGSLAPSGSAFMIENKAYVSLTAAIGMLSLDTAPDTTRLKNTRLTIPLFYRSILLPTRCHAVYVYVTAKIPARTV